MIIIRKTIADTMIEVMNEQQFYIVDVGTPSLWVDVFERCKVKPSKNCLENGTRVMNALEKSDKFTKGYTYYSRKVRTFTLKEDYRIEKSNKSDI